MELMIRYLLVAFALFCFTVMAEARQVYEINMRGSALRGPNIQVDLVRELQRINPYLNAYDNQVVAVKVEGYSYAGSGVVELELGYQSVDRQWLTTQYTYDSRVSELNSYPGSLLVNSWPSPSQTPPWTLQMDGDVSLYRIAVLLDSVWQQPNPGPIPPPGGTHMVDLGEVRVTSTAQQRFSLLVRQQCVTGIVVEGTGGEVDLQRIRTAGRQSGTRDVYDLAGYYQYGDRYSAQVGCIDVERLSIMAALPRGSRSYDGRLNIRAIVR